MDDTSAGDRRFDDILKGRVTDVMPEKSNIVRVFISSTFTDMCTERDTLLDKAYPELQAFCHSLGLVFEVVDMRWGVRDAIIVDHKTTELCLREIKSCQKLSVGPTFTALIGNRYGYRPIPRVIEEKEFEMLLGKLHSDADSIKNLTKWFWKDENSDPSVYVLQPITTLLPHYNDIRPESKEQRDKDVATWRRTEAELSQALRTAAAQAEIDGDFTAEQKHKFFKSVTEWEIENGLMAVKNSEVYAVLFLRELSNQSDLEGHCPFPQFVDVKEGGYLDTEAQELLSSLKTKITSCFADKLNVHSVQLNKGSISPQNKIHARYLELLCNQFISDMKQQILQRIKQKTVDEQWENLIQEVVHHMSLSANKCAVFCGRVQLLGNICSRVKENNASIHPPIIVHGPSGIGKTATMCKLSQEVHAVLGEDTVTVLRLLGTSPGSSEVHSLLKSICFQICRVFELQLPAPYTTNNYEELVRFFHNSLVAVSQKNGIPLVLILDSLDQLSPSNGAHRLHWLPKECPPKVHILVSTLENPILTTLHDTILDSTSFFQVDQMPHNQGKEVVGAYMAAAGRRLTAPQKDLILEGFDKCGQPLQLKLILDAARQWASYTPMSELKVPTSTQEAVLQLLERLEEQHGRLLVAHALSSIVISRNGLTEIELRDILSLDDDVLGDIYQYWLPPNKEIIRLPPLLWTRLRHDMGEYLVERQADGMKVLGLYHRQFTETVEKRYLSKEQKTLLHHILADFFQGKWSRGEKKAISLPSLKINLKPDRKVAAQPLWFSENVPNLRKLREMPYHLLNAGRIEELKRDVIGNMDWLVCKTDTCGIRSVIEDLSMCCEQVNCPEVRLIRDTFLIFKPTIDFIEGKMDTTVLYVEIFSRLHYFEKKYPSLIGRLCLQCCDWLQKCPNPSMTPLCGFFQPPGGPLKTTVTGITAVEACCESSLMIVGSEDGQMIVWNLEDVEVIHTLTGHKGQVECAKLFHKGSQAVSAARDNTLRLWNLLTGKQVYAIEVGHGSDGGHSSLHMNEQSNVVYWCAGFQVNAWNLDTKALLFNISTDGTKFTVIPGSQPIVSLSDTGLVTVWDSSTGQTANTFSLNRSCPACLLPLKQGQVIAGFVDGSIILISTNGRYVVENVESAVSLLALSEDETIICAGYGNFIATLQVKSNAMVQMYADHLEHDEEVQSAVVSVAQEVIVSGSKDETIRVWSLYNGLLLDSFRGMGAPVSTLALFRDVVVSASRSTYYLKFWHLGYDKSHRTKLPVPQRSSMTTLLHSGDLVYFPQASDKKKIVIWDDEEGVTKDTIDTSAEVCCLEIAQAKRLLFCGLVSGTVLVFPLDSPSDTMCLPPPASRQKVCCFGVSPKEEWLAVAYEDTILLYDIYPGMEHCMVEGPDHTFVLPQKEIITSIAVLSNYRIVYGTEAGEVTLHLLKESTSVPLKSHGSNITCIAVSHAETHALIGSQDSVQRLWDLNLSLLDHEIDYKGILCAAFSQDDQFVFTGSHDRTIKVWHVDNGTLLAVQYVYASVIRIIPTSEGFTALTYLGYVIKEKFSCPRRVPPQYNPLQNFRASYTLNSRKPPPVYPSPSPDPQKKVAQRDGVRASQMCYLL
ncbi:NWD1 protein, partial [Polypterus senegalus]